jgi:DUF1680 family protein
MSKLEANSKFKIRRQIAAKLRTSNFWFASSFGFRIFLLTLAPLVAAAANLTPLDPNDVRWTHGFWAERIETCRTQTIPALWRIMEGTNYSHFFENFRIAAGLSEGRHRGAPFNDGDFYKWLEAASATLAVTNDPYLEQIIERCIDVIAKAQRQDGYIHTPVLIGQRNDIRGGSSSRPFQNPIDFEMYNTGHLMSAACVHYRVTGRTNFIVVARKAADFLCETFRKPTPDLARNAICPSHYMGTIDLYRVTHDPRYLELAKKLFAMRDLVSGGTDDNQDRIAFLQQTNALGHAVRANYLYAGAADLFLETGEPSLLSTLERIWTNVVQQKMYVTGGCGALYDGASPDGSKDQKSITRVHQAYGRNYQLPNLTAHSETCANIGNVLWNWRMFLATGEGRYMDVLELAVYNSVLSGVSLEGTNFFYTNPLRSLDPPPVELRWKSKRVPFVSSFCCPPNLARTIAESSGYAWAKSADGLWLNLYGSSELSTKLSDGSAMRITEETDYPWNGHVQIRITECGGSPFAFHLRIPSWAKEAKIRLNDNLTGLSSVPGSYCELRRSWRAGDELIVDFPMSPRLIEANPFVEETFNQIAVQRGPLIYCLESCDLPSNARASLRDICVPSNMELVARFERNVLNGVVLLEGKALNLHRPNWNGQLYREFQPAAGQPLNVRFVPYFAWANRGPSEMTVWLPLSRQ